MDKIHILDWFLRILYVIPCQITEKDLVWTFVMADSGKLIKKLISRFVHVEIIVVILMIPVYVILLILTAKRKFLAQLMEVCVFHNYQHLLYLQLLKALHRFVLVVLMKIFKRYAHKEMNVLMLNVFAKLAD